jgi:hypothetical protein
MDGEPTAERWDQMATWGVKVARQGFFWEWISKPNADQLGFGPACLLG